MLNIKNLKREHLAHVRDGNEDKFFELFQEGLDSKQITLKDVSLREIAESFIDGGHEAADVAAAVVFLASSGAAYITGATLHVNGGMDMA